MYTSHELIENGYTQVFLSNIIHNHVFKHRPLEWNIRYEYYILDGQYYILGLTSKIAFVTNIICYPFFVIMSGISGIDELHTEYKRMFSERKMDIILLIS